MRDMYNQHCHPPEPCGPHPEWTPYPHPGHPPVSYYMTAYDIAVKYGYDGTEEEWLKTLKGATGFSAYEIAVEHGYEGTEDEWNAEVNLSMTEAMLARDEAVSASAAAQESEQQVADMMRGLPDGYADVCGKLEALRRRVAAHSAAIIDSVQKDTLFYKYRPIDTDDLPNLDDYKTEVHIQFAVAVTSANDDVPKCPGILHVLKGADTGVGAVQFWFPVGDKDDHTHRDEIWFRPRYIGANGSMYWGTFRCLNMIDERELEWEVEA